LQHLLSEMWANQVSAIEYFLPDSLEDGHVRLNLLGYSRI